MIAMLRRDVLRALLASSSARWLGPWASWAFRVATDEGRNAASIYERAFGWARDLPKVEADCLRQASTVPLRDRRVDRLIRQARPALEALREAAAVGHCRWEVETLATKHLGRGQLEVANRHIVRVACLSARRHARAGRGHEALDDLFAGLTLAHRIGTHGVLIARLYEAAGEITAFETLGRILPELDRGALDDLSRRLDVLPPPQPASATIGPESRFILSTFRAKIMGLGPVLDDDVWAELGCAQGKPESGALRRLVGSDRARLLAHLDATGPAYAELARRLDLPWRQCRGALDEFVKAERGAQPVVTGLVESAWTCRVTVERLHVLRAMARAGLALVAAGEGAFRTFSHPMQPGPFELERRSNGCVVRSAKDDHGMPELTLLIGYGAP